MMEINKRNIDEFFQEELGGLTEMPPSSVWDTLEKRLDDNKPKSKKIAWWLLPFIATVFIGGSIAAYVVMHHKASNITTLPINANDFTKTSSSNNNSTPIIAQTNNAQSSHQTESDQSGTKSQVSEIKQLDQNTENRVSKQTSHSKKVSNQSNEASSLIVSKPKTNTAIKHSVSKQNITYNSSNYKNSNESLNNHNLQKSTDDQLVNNSTNLKKSVANNENVLQQSVKKNPVAVKKESFKNQTSNSVLSDKRFPNSNIPGSKENSSSKADINSSTVATTKTSNVTGSSAMATNMELNSSAQRIKKRLDANAFATKEETQENTKAIAKKPIAASSVVADNQTSDRADQTTAKPSKENQTAALQSGKNEKKGGSANQETSKNKNTQQSSAMSASTQAMSKKEEASKSKSQNQAKTPEQQKTNQLPKEAAKTTGDEINNERGESGAGGGSTVTKEPKQKRPLNMLLGIKAGYESGMEQYKASKYVGTVFAEVSFSKKVSFILQPGIKLAQTNQDYVLSSNGYFKINENGVNPYNVRKDSFGTPTGYDYAYVQSYDSIIATQQANRKYMEIELPFLFRFKFNEHFSLLGGMNFTFGKILAFSNNLKTIAGLRLYDTILNSPDSVAPSAPSRFSHPGSTPFSSYKEDNTAAISPIRFGYSFGISYQVKERLMLDLFIQQNLSRLNSIKDEGIRKLYTQPYVRFSVGYNIFGVKRK